jgi:hypothetical protein
MREQLENYIRILKEKLEKSKQNSWDYDDYSMGIIDGKEAEREQVILELEEIYHQVYGRYEVL